MNDRVVRSVSRWRASRAIIAVLITVPLMLALAASNTSRAANSRDDLAPSANNAPVDPQYAQAPGPDLCALLKEVAGSEPVNQAPGVGKPGAGYQCAMAMRNGAYMTLTNFGVEQARVHVLQEKSMAGGWVPSALGDPGYGFESPAHESPDPYLGWSGIYLIYARGCYFVQASGGKDPDTHKPADQPAIPAIAAALDSALQQPPYSACGATPKSDLDLTVDHIEAVQVVQDVNNSVPRVANKKTLLRVFVKVDGAKGAVSNVTAVLRASLGGTPVTLTPTYGAITAPLTPDRSERAHAISFILPPALISAGTHSFEVTINPDKSVTETDYSNNSLSSQLTFVKMPTLRIGYVRIGYKPPGATDFVWPTGPIQDYADFLHAIYPIADGEEGLKYYQEPFEVRVTRAITSDEEYLNLVWSVRTLYNMMSADKPDQLVAWLPVIRGKKLESMAEPVVEINELMPGMALPRVTVAHDIPTVPEDSQVAMAHEIGHNLGLKHTATHDPAPCVFADNFDPPYWEYQDDSGTIHEVGYDPRNGELRSPENYDVMTYCDHTKTWISPFHYKSLFNGNLQARPITIYQAEEYLAIRARIKNDQAGGRIWGRRIPATAGGSAPSRTVSTVSPGFGLLSSFAGFTTHAPVLQTQGEGDYCLRFTDDSGIALSQYCTDLKFNEHQTGARLDEAGLALVLPYPDGATHLALLDHGQEVAGLDAGNAPPSVTITSPRPGDTWEGAHTITWSATDPQGDGLMYDVLYSANGGKSWFPLAIDLTEARFDFSTAEIAPGDQTYFRVLATSGLDTTIADVGPVIVPQQPGSPQIPPGGETVAGPGTTVAPAVAPDSSLLYILGGGALLVIAAGIGVFVVMGAGRRRLAAQTAQPPYGVPPYPNAPQYPPQYSPQQMPPYQGYAQAPAQSLPRRGSRVPLMLLLLLLVLGGSVAAGFLFLGWKLPAIGGNSSSSNGGITQPTVVTGGLDTRQYPVSLDDLLVGEWIIKDAIEGSDGLVRYLRMEARPYEDPDGDGVSRQAVGFQVAIADGQNKIGTEMWLVTSQELVDDPQQLVSGTSNARVELAQEGKSYEMTSSEGWLLKVTAHSVSVDENAELTDGSKSPYPVFAELELEVEVTPR